VRRLRLLALGLAALLAAAGCGAASRSQADQDRDGRVVGDALQQAIGQGTGFTMQDNLALSAADMPNGGALQFQAESRNGQIKGDKATFDYRVTVGAKPGQYDMVISGGQLFVRKHGDQRWRSVPVSAAVTLVPAARLDLLRQTVLLASFVSPSEIAISGGLVRKYQIRPAPDQLGQLLGADGLPANFHKSGEMDVYLGLLDKKLVRADLHLTMSDPTGQQKLQLDSTIEVHPSQVGQIHVPTSATPIGPQDNILS
jgi:hypothetical protein